MPDELNARLLESMAARGLNASSLADRAGVAHGTVYQWLRRPETKVRPETLRPVAAVLGWSVDDAYRWAGIIPVEPIAEADLVRDAKRAIAALPMKPASRSALLHLTEELSRPAAPQDDPVQKFRDAWASVTGPYAAGDVIPDADWLENMEAELLYRLYGVTRRQRP